MFGYKNKSVVPLKLFQMVNSSKIPSVLALIILFIVVLPLISPGFLVLSAEKRPRNLQVSTWILIPAVVMGIPHEEGRLLNVTITITIPGNGTIIVSNEGGEISGSTRFSMATAVATASLLNGIDWTTFNTYIYIHSRGSISGPSGSLAIATATYVLLNPLLNDQKLHNYVITGAIAPEGLAGSVGGVKTKCKAALNRNLTFMLPLSNVNDLKGSDCRNYIPVTDVISAISTIYKLRPLVKNINLSTSYPKPLAEVMDSFTENITELTEKNINETTNELTKVPINEANTIRTYISYADKYIQSAKKYAAKYPYSAASYAYTAYIYSLFSKYQAFSYTNKINVILPEEISRINNTLKSLANELSEIKPLSLEKTELLSVAAARLADAYLSLSTVKLLIHSKINTSLILYQLALASGRTESIKSWLLSAEKVKGSIFISKNFTKNLALKAYRFALLNLGYAISLLNSSGLKTEASALEKLEERMAIALKKKDWILVIGYAREAISQATDYTFEYSISTLPPAEKKKIDPIYANNIETIAKMLTLSIGLHGIKSPLAPTYIEYYKVLKNNNEYDAALKLLWSAVADLEILSLAFLKSPSPTLSLSNTSTPIPPMSIIRSVPSQTSSAFFYIAIFGALILGIAVGYVLAIRSTLKEIEKRLS